LNLRKGWYKASNGYVYIWEPNHPNAKSKGYVAEHAKVMAAILGRLSCQRRKCIIATDGGMITALRILSCGLGDGNHPEHELAISWTRQ
jgi:hypothetical protein